jgi:VanZ family protein
MSARRFSRYLPLFLWMAIISLASTGSFSGDNTSRFIRPLVLWLFPNISAESLALIHFTVRKLSHFAEYAVLGFLAARAFASSKREIFKQRWFSLSLFLVVIYALLDEYHQSFVPSRGASIYDCLIDTSGGLAALLIFALRRARRQARAEAQLLRS